MEAPVHGWPETDLPGGSPGDRAPIVAQLALAYAASAEALLAKCGDALGEGIAVVCRASFGIVRPACAPLRSYCRVAEGDRSTHMEVCVKLIDGRGNITVNGVLEWFLMGPARPPGR